MSKSLLAWCCLATVSSGQEYLVKVIFLLGLVHKDNSGAKHVHQQLMCSCATVEIPLGNVAMLLQQGHVRGGSQGATGI